MSQNTQQSIARKNVRTTRAQQKRDELRNFISTAQDKVMWEIDIGGQCLTSSTLVDLVQKTKEIKKENVEPVVVQ